MTPHHGKAPRGGSVIGRARRQPSRRYLSEDELRRLKAALDEKQLRKGTKDVNRTTQRMRLIVHGTDYRNAGIRGFRASLAGCDVRRGLAGSKGEIERWQDPYVPLLPEVAGELRRYPVVISDDRVFPPRKGAYGNRRRLEGSFEDLLRRASWYMMNGGDLYELAKILGHSNIKMTERYAKLGRKHIARTGTRHARFGKLWGRKKATKRTSFVKRLDN